VTFHGLERLLRQQLRGVKCLLVLDGCTGLVGAPWLQDLLEKLLRDAQGVHVLTTTKSPLGGLPSIYEVIHKLHPLDYDDAAILLGLLLGKYAVRSCNIDRDRARTIAFSKGGHPGKVLEAAKEMVAAMDAEG